jgi:hypothetical protein
LSLRHPFTENEGSPKNFLGGEKQTPKFHGHGHRWTAGLPDGVFAYQKSQFWHSLEGLGMEKFGTFYGHSLFYDYLV